MIIVFFDIRGIVHCEFVPQGQTVNSVFHLKVLRRLKRWISRVRTDIKDTVKLHHDNATSHTAFIITNFLARSNTPLIPDPPYSPDLAPCDFFLFPRLKREMKGKHWETVENIQHHVTTFLRSIPVEEFQDYVQCPSCGRNFNAGAAARHIPWCKEQLEIRQAKEMNEAQNKLRARTKYDTGVLHDCTARTTVARPVELPETTVLCWQYKAPKPRRRTSRSADKSKPRTQDELPPPSARAPHSSPGLLENTSDYSRHFSRRSRGNAEDPLSDYRMITVTYGTVPFLAIRIIQQLAEDENSNFSSASSIIFRDFYVEDLISGARSIQEANTLVSELSSLLNKGGFKLRKWSSNNN
ncbi:hypothetical protein LAZ67_3005836 [Cordylochernes scorpioides]|uniref:C2HC/C3H-type domain-containing protein n=1 Tax=Cordylochernes scorpioides TaxID=51811 RepID=A0ABY6KCG8_9ARAC|nr:hypothetical protein LAZ67_3005836 [Cordylochernes scorpioides]